MEKWYFENVSFCEKWDFENVNFVKNEILKMWNLSKLRFSNCEFCQKWDFQNCELNAVLKSELLDYKRIFTPVYKH